MYEVNQIKRFLDPFGMLFLQEEKLNTAKSDIKCTITPTMTNNLQGNNFNVPLLLVTFDK